MLKVDSGNHTLFSSYSPCNSPIFVQIANGLLSKVARVGTVSLENITLQSVLFVPNYDCNSKIISALNCMTKLSSNCCIFWDLEPGWIIGNAELRAGLYILTPQVSGVSLNKKSSCSFYHSLSSQFCHIKIVML